MNKLKIIWETYLAELQKLAPNDKFKIGDGASAEEIQKLSKTVGEIPDELVEFLKIVNGTGSLLNDMGMLSCGAISSQWQFYCEEMADTLDAKVSNEGWLKTGSGWRREWLAIASDGGGNMWVLDRAPGVKGEIGQVFELDNYLLEGVLIGNSIADLLQRVVSKVRDGEGDDLLMIDLDKLAKSNI